MICRKVFLRIAKSNAWFHSGVTYQQQSWDSSGLDPSSAFALDCIPIVGEIKAAEQVRSDKYRDITLKKRTIVYAGEPGAPFKIRDATALFEVLQVSPRNGLYRPRVTAFEIIEDTPVAFGITRANPQYGVGGLPQLYIPNYANITKPVISYPLSNRFMRGK